MVSGRVYVAGHTGLVGSACLRRWTGRPGVELLTATRRELDLTDGPAVRRWMAERRPAVVVMAAGRVGGIRANATAPAEFIYENLMVEANLIDAAWRAGVGRVINFGSGCMYPKSCDQPMRVDQLLTGPMEPTSRPYAIAKLAGVAMVEAYNRQYGTAFTSVIPCTLYGPGDSFDPDGAHVIAALLRKLHEAAEQARPSITLWGSGNARREFLYVDDLIAAIELLLDRPALTGPVNIGFGESIAIHELAETIASVTGFTGRLEWDASQPEGPADKRLDSGWIRSVGWRPALTLREGLERTYRWWTGETGAARRGRETSHQGSAACASS
jgi:GDP-L-fucose synthase